MTKYLVLQPLPIPQDVNSGLSETFGEGDVYSLQLISTSQIDDWLDSSAEGVLSGIIERTKEIIAANGTDVVYALVCSGATLPNSLVAAELARSEVNWVMLQWERRSKRYVVFTPYGEKGKGVAMIVTPFFVDGA